MIRIRQDISVVDALQQILDTYFSATPPTDFKKQVFQRMKDRASVNPDFRDEVERSVNYCFCGRGERPTLDEIRGLVENSLEDELTIGERDMRNLLEDAGIVGMARRIAKDATTWCGYEMTAEQKYLCERVWVSVSDWCKAVPKGCEIRATIEATYEHETGKSCVNWRDEADWGLRDTLPRSAEYTTEGYTQEFENWATALIVWAVCEAGCETQLEVADLIRKVCPMVQG